MLHVKVCQHFSVGPGHVDFRLNGPYLPWTKSLHAHSYQNKDLSDCYLYKYYHLCKYTYLYEQQPDPKNQPSKIKDDSRNKQLRLTVCFSLQSMEEEEYDQAMHLYISVYYTYAI